MRPVVVLATICLLCAWLGQPAGADPGDPATSPAPPRFTWLAADGTETWSLALGRVGDPVVDGTGGAVPLHAPPWFPRLPSLDGDLIDGGGRVALDEFAGQVLLIDFWATWCVPCTEELPWLQRFQDAERGRGLAVLTVNMNESDATARRFADRLGLRLPIARYGKAFEDAFRVRPLPAVLVVDRGQRIRARFEGTSAGIERHVADLARRLLEEIPDPGPEIARVRLGGDRFEVRWSRSTDATVQGLAVLPPDGPREGRVLAAAGRTVTAFGAGGQTDRSVRVGPGVERIEIAGTGPPLIGFRPAGSRIVPLVLDGEAAESWQAPAPAMDLYVEPASGETTPTLWLATIEGVYRVGIDGAMAGARTDLGLVLQIAPAEAGAVALVPGGRLLWLDTDLETLRERDAPSGTRVLASLPELAAGLGVGPGAITGVAAGRLLEGGESQVAIAVAGQLLVADLGSGRERLRADWPRIGAVAVGDLDGDGRDELIVGSGRRVTALYAPSVESEASP